MQRRLLPTRRASRIDHHRAWASRQLRQINQGMAWPLPHPFTLPRHCRTEQTAHLGSLNQTTPHPASRANYDHVGVGHALIT